MRIVWGLPESKEGRELGAFGPDGYGGAWPWALWVDWQVRGLSFHPLTMLTNSESWQQSGCPRPRRVPKPCVHTH